MTSPPTHARTPNEQRIAFLECQVVTMREALEGLNGIVCESRGVDGWHRNGNIALWTEFPNTIGAMDSALSTSTECAAKVVVDREELLQLTVLENLFRAGENDNQHYDHCLTRLDSLRKGGGA